MTLTELLGLSYPTPPLSDFYLALNSMQRPETPTAPNAYGRPTLKRLGPLARFTLGGPTGAAEPGAGGGPTNKKSAAAARQ